MNNEYLISALLLIAFTYVVWAVNRDGHKQGQSNPVGTAKLQKDVTALGTKVTVIETRLGEIEKDIAAAPTKADIDRLQERVEGVMRHVEKIDNAVVRISDFLMTNGGSAK